MLALIALLALVLATATLSGVFGMAGGLLLMAGSLALLPLPAAMVTHGAVQLVSNGWRAFLHRAHLRGPILLLHALGSGAAAALLALVAYAPSKALVCLLLGLAPASLWLPERILRLDAARPAHALLSGFLVTGLNVLAGVSGPLLDLFFVRTTLTRHEIVATKAATQTLAHAAKILFYGAPLLAAATTGLPPAPFFALALPLAMLGAALGARILARFSDAGFRRTTRWIVTAIGIGYLARALLLRTA